MHREIRAHFSDECRVVSFSSGERLKGMDEARSDLFLFEVEDVFFIKGLGLMLCPGISYRVHKIKIGQPLTILKPDGEQFQTTLKAFFMGRHVVRSDIYPFILPKNFQREDVPLGSQVWIMGDSDDEG